MQDMLDYGQVFESIYILANIGLSFIGLPFIGLPFIGLSFCCIKNTH